MFGHDTVAVPLVNQGSLLETTITRWPDSCARSTCLSRAAVQGSASPDGERSPRRPRTTVFTSVPAGGRESQRESRQPPSRNEHRCRGFEHGVGLTLSHRCGALVLCARRSGTAGVHTDAGYVDHNEAELLRWPAAAAISRITLTHAPTESASLSRAAGTSANRHVVSSA